MPDVILPALDEADAVAGVLGSIPYGYHPIVVDNGSVDATASIARDLGARVVVEERRGFGAACWTGLLASTEDVVCFMDCDGSIDGRDLARVAEPVSTGAADLVVAARVAERGAWPRHARVANAALAWDVRRRTGVALSDVGPLRAARRAELLSLGMTDRRFGWPLEMVLRAAAAGWRVCEVRARYSPRVGRSKVTGTVRGTARAVLDMGRIAHRVGTKP